MKRKTLLVKKAIVERIPFVDGVRKLKRKALGYPPNTEYIQYTIENYDRIKAAIGKSDGVISGATILEIGSGWFPTIPILFARDGAKKIYLTDLNVHMDELTFAETTSLMKQYFPNDDFIQSLNDISDLPFEYLAPFNTSDVADKSIDLITSHLVLEHIPRSDIFNLFTALRPKISDEGLSINLVDHSDHFEHFDKSISRIEFLTMSEEQHGVVNYLIKDGENRLRHQEYHQIFTDSGFNVIDEEIDVDQKTVETIKTMNLKYPYSTMTPEQLAAMTSIYTLSPLACKTEVVREPLLAEI